MTTLKVRKKREAFTAFHAAEGAFWDDLVDFSMRPARGGMKNAVVFLVAPLSWDDTAEQIGQDLVDKFADENAIAAVNSYGSWQPLHLGQWLVRDAEGEIEIVDDETYRAEYEKDDTDE